MKPRHLAFVGQPGKIFALSGYRSYSTDVALVNHFQLSTKSVFSFSNKPTLTAITFALLDMPTVFSKFKRKERECVYSDISLSPVYGKVYF